MVPAMTHTCLPALPSRACSFILLVVWLFASINRVYELASDGNQIFALYLLQRSLSSAQGLLNAFAYGFSGASSDGARGRCRTSVTFPCAAG